MAVLTSGRHTADFLVSKANDGYRSFETGIVDGTAAALVPGTLLGQITATKRWVRHAPGASDGSEVVKAILFEGVGLAEIVERTLVVRDAEVMESALTYSSGADATAKATANTALNALGIALR